MKQLTSLLFISTLIFTSCSSDDDNSNQIDLVSHFKINDDSPYLTPNGYYTHYTLEDARDKFILYFTDGEFIPIDPYKGVQCPWVKHMNHGVTIWLKSNTNDLIAPGTYQYTSSADTSGITTNSELFYGFQSDSNCYSSTEEISEITDGEMTISKENDFYTIIYSFISESGKEIEGEYYGELINHISPE